MNRDSNAYTFGFAAVMVVVVASVLAFAATSLQDLQAENVRKEKMQNILATIGIEIDREAAEAKFNEYIESQLSLRKDGTIDPSVNAFSDINLAIEVKKNSDEQRFPLYVANVDNEKYYIIPLRGAGLWDAIWGYISLKSDKNTIKGVVFDHKAETAGLGAEITQQWFQDRFIDEKVFAKDGKLMGIVVSKTNNDPNNLDKDDHEVDAISGATITGDGVTDMISERLQYYIPYFEQEKQSDTALNELSYVQ